MKEASIDELAYMLKQAKENNDPQPIVFLGAGASKTGGVPLAGEIVLDILKDYGGNPRVKKLDEKQKTYANLMECLLPSERNKLLKGYIDTAKVNVTHIYLAQLIIAGYVDYVLTVNFDNLMLRALALFNEFPATYDMAILKDLTTTSFKEKSVVYLHGQHHGLWLLNTKEEMSKVNEVIPPILNSIKDQRPWIFIGYSGEDPIFNHIKKLGRFDNGLYWVTYQDKTPNDNVCKELLDKENTNAFLIKGYDSDSFMLKLAAELKVEQPPIIEKPFSALKLVLENIVDIDDKEHYKGVKERLEIAKRNVDTAINQFEKGQVENGAALKTEVNAGLLKKRIIDLIINDNYAEATIEAIEKDAETINNEEINATLAVMYNGWGNLLSENALTQKDELMFSKSFEKYKRATVLNPKDDSAFYNWGIALSDLAKLKNDELHYMQACDKYKTATELNPKNDSAFYNWGNALYDLAKLKNDELLYMQACDKYKTATELNPKKDAAFNNWGIALSDLAKLKNDELLYLRACDKYKTATELNPKKDAAFYNWGIALYDLAKLKNDELLYLQAGDKYEEATELNPKDDNSFYNWGNALYDLAKLKNDELLYMQACDKYKEATELNPKKDAAFYNWGIALSDLAKLKNDELLYIQAGDKYKEATELNPKKDAAFYNWGIALSDLAKLKNDELLYLRACDKYKEATALNPKNDAAFNNWGNTLYDLAKLKNDELLYIQACDKYKTATELNPKKDVAFDNWGAALASLSKLKKNQNLLLNSIEKLNAAVELGASPYNLACSYALLGDKPNALDFLKKTLQEKSQTIDFVLQDEDWKNYLEDADFKALIEKYKGT